MHERVGTTKKNRKSFMDTIMPTYAMATRGKRAPMPLPGGQAESSDGAPPPLPARRPPPPVPQVQSASDEDDSYEEPSAKHSAHNVSLQEIYDDFDELLDDFPPPPPNEAPLPPPPPPSRPSRPVITQDSQELYDEFELEDDPPPISPYNPITTQEPQEIYDEFEEVNEDQEVYEDPDESPAPPPTSKNPKSSAAPPPLPPLDHRPKRGSTPLPPPPGAKRDLPPPPVQTHDEQDIYEPTDDIDNDEDSGSVSSPVPPPLPAGRGPKPPTPQRKVQDERKKSGPTGGLAIGAIDIQGALKGLRKVSTGDKSVEDKNSKNEKNKNAKEALPFGDKKTLFDGKAKEKDGGILSGDHHRNGDTNNNVHNRPLPPAKDFKPSPLVPKIPPIEKEETKNNSVSSIGSKFGGVKSLISEISKKPDPPVKPLPTTPKPALKPKSESENDGVKTVQLTPRLKAKFTKSDKGTNDKDKVVSPTKETNGPPLPPRPESDTPEESNMLSNKSTLPARKPPPPPEEDFPAPPPFDEDEQEIYDDAFSQDLDPMMKFSWYHGSVERKEGERLLKSIGKDGTFLVRKSTKGPDQPYTMAVLYQDRVNNLKIRRRDDNRIALGEAKPNEISFKDVEGMIEHHKKHPVLLIGTQKGEITLQNSPHRS